MCNENNEYIPPNTSQLGYCKLVNDTSSYFEHLRLISIQRMKSQLITRRIVEELSSTDSFAPEIINGNVPKEIGSMVTLKYLSLQGGGVIELPPEIGNLVNLEILDLINNKLTTLPPEIVNLVKLRSIDLTGNRITSLPKELAKLSQLKHVVLILNPELDSSNIRSIIPRDSHATYVVDTKR